MIKTKEEMKNDRTTSYNRYAADELKTESRERNDEATSTRRNNVDRARDSRRIKDELLERIRKIN